MVKNQISFIFNLSKQIGEQIMVGSKNSVAKHTIVDNLAQLTTSLIELVGADLSAFEKTNKKPESYTEVATDKAVSDYTDTQTMANNVSDYANFSADEILIRGTYKTSPAIVGDVIVTKITPDGVKFDVTFENNRLFVQQTRPESQDKSNTTPEM